MDCQLDHIGYVTDDIASTALSFRLLGYTADEVVNDDTQRTRICFLRKQGETAIELVEPYEDNKTMQKMLKRGVAPYHTCYVVENIMAAYEEMLDHDFTPLFKPVPAPAFDHRLICYFFKQEAGLIELVNRK
jgi:methylmalonyl-CoA/ethylmalonyl-CoA epimerase